MMLIYLIPKRNKHIFEFIVCICLYLYAAIDMKIQRVFGNYRDRNRNYCMRIE